MSTHTPLPKVSYQRQHEGSWLLLRDGVRIGRMDRDLESQLLTVMVDNLYWNTEGTKLQAHGGMAVKTFNKRMGLKLICIDVAFALREMENGGEVQPAAITPKPKITIDLEPVTSSPNTVNGVSLDTTESGNVLLSIGADSLGMSPYQARAAWYLLAQHLGEPIGSGLDGHQFKVQSEYKPLPDPPIIIRERKERAAAALRLGLANMWEDMHDTKASDDNIMDMGEALADLLEIRR